MFFARNKCDTCACVDVCSVRADIDSFRLDMMKLEWFNGKTYAERLPMVTVKVECNNYIDKEKMHSMEVGD